MNDTKKCSMCDEEKPLSEFYRSGKGTNQPVARCKACTRKRVKQLRDLQRQNPEHRKKKKDRDAIYRENNRERIRENHRKWCRENTEHQRAYNKSYHATHPRKKTTPEQNRRAYVKSARGSHLKKKYGITEDDYEIMLKEQDGKCAICGTSDPMGRSQDGKFHVDHCHQTGEVRGLLCSRCNLGIGAFLDNAELLMSAVRFLSAKRTDNAG